MLLQLKGLLRSLMKDVMPQIKSLLTSCDALWVGSLHVGALPGKAGH